MTTIRLDRFTVDPARAEEMRTKRHALIAAVRAAVPGLVETRLARVDERTWLDIWTWDSHDNAMAAVARARAGSFPEAGAAFALTSELTTEFTEVVD